MKKFKTIVTSAGRLGDWLNDGDDISKEKKKIV